jgi:succinate dehydrogenase / fumarate reductase cytochrome b subunit
MRAFGDVWRSNIFQKWVMAVTGVLLVLFLIGHLSGNLLVFLGAEHMNEYGHSLRVMLHGSAIWVVRAGLALTFILHIWSAIRLVQRNKVARPEKYVKVASRSSTLASRSMALSGLSLLVYLLYHLAHFTWGTAHSQYFAAQAGWEYTLKDGTLVPDVYRMVLESFHDPSITILYLVAMVVLGLHLNHAVASAFQTLGVTNGRLVPLIRVAGPLLGLGISLGFMSVPIAVLAGLVH